VFVALCILVTGGGYAYFRWQFSRINRVSLPVVDPGNTTDPGSGVLYPDERGEPMNVLLVGSDSRENLTGADCRRNCRDEQGRLVTGKRSDTIMVLHADPARERAAILSIPRDLWVRIAGTNRSQRINSAYERGEGVLIRTITDNLGIQINHFVEVDFVGFRNLVNAVDGVPIYVPAPARDRYSDLNIPQAGCITLTGDQALAWVRSRHYQYYEAGRWRTDPRSDFGRILRQQDFIRRLMKRSISRGIRNPITLNRMINIAVKNVTIDSEMSSKDILRLGQRFRSLDPESVEMYTLPVVSARIGGADVLRLKQPEASQIIDLFMGRETAVTPAIPPEAVRVRTLNGSGVSGVASRTATALANFGFQNVATGDADRFTYQRTVIRYGRGQLDKARLLQSYLRAGAALEEDRTLSVDVVLVIGRDFAGVARPAAPGQAPTTTQPTTTTTQPPVPIPKGAPPQPQC
jgi:LCP family protein required for cell wall assembly